MRAAQAEYYEKLLVQRGLSDVLRVQMIKNKGKVRSRNVLICVHWCSPCVYLTAYRVTRVRIYDSAVLSFFDYMQDDIHTFYLSWYEYRHVICM